MRRRIIKNNMERNESSGRRLGWSGLANIGSWLAISAFICLIVRSCVQAVTIDEAYGYITFANPSLAPDLVWYPNPPNHVLYTLLSRFSTWVFGLNELTLRLPALLGAAAYIGASLYICMLLLKGRITRVVVFAAVVFNPFILDHLVAARGYSLAIGFMLLALALLARVVYGGSPWANQRPIVLASVALGLSVCACFAFAFVDAAVLGVFWLWAIRELRSWPDKVKASAFTILPAIAVMFAICGWTLLHWPKGLVLWGTSSIRESWNGILESCFDRLNPVLVNPLLRLILSHLSGPLAYAGVAVTILLGCLLAVHAVRWRRDASARLFWFFATILAVALAAHWIAFRAFHLLLPHRRTGLFIAPLAVLTLGAALSVQIETRPFVVLRVTGVSVLMLSVAYFLGCLQFDHFREWYWNADAKHAYWVINDLNRRCGVTDFATEWRYINSLNFYRLYFANRELKEFTRGDPFRPGNTGYVVNFSDPASYEFVRAQGLHTIYHNPETNTAIAIAGNVCP